MNQIFSLRTFFRSALAFLEPQIFIDVQRVGAENISLLSGRLVYTTFTYTHKFFSTILLNCSLTQNSFPLTIILNCSKLNTVQHVCFHLNAFVRYFVTISSLEKHIH